MTQEEIDKDWERRHAGLKEGELYIGSDGHHHHYHSNSHHHHHKRHSDDQFQDTSEIDKRRQLSSSKRRRLYGKILFVFLCLVAIAILAFLVYIYTVEN